MIKFFLNILLITLALSCSTSRDQALVNMEDIDSNSYRANSVKVYPKRINTVIKGVCLIGGDDNNLGDYCRNINLALKDKSKKIISITKTKQSGHFIFTDIKDGLYELIVTDKSYIKYSEKIYVVPGAEVLLHIKKLKGVD